MDDTLTPAEAHDSAIESMTVDTVTAKPLDLAKEPVAAAETDTTTEASAAAAEPVAGAEPTTEGTTKPPKVEPWVQKKWDDLAKETREARRAAKQAADELATIKAASAKPAEPTAADAEAVTAAAPNGGFATKAEFDAAVAAEANNRAANEQAAIRKAEFNAKSNAAADAGKATFGADFDTAIKNLFSVGLLPMSDPDTGQVSNEEILAMVLETEDPAKVLFALGSDPAKATDLLGMTPAKRAIEIAKISVATPKKATPVPISNAPRPVVPVNGSAASSAEPSDDDDDDTFFRKREAQLAAAR